MKLYHGSPISGLQILNNSFSHKKNHEGEYLYLVDSKSIAKIYSSNNFNSNNGSIYTFEIADKYLDLSNEECILSMFLELGLNPVMLRNYSSILIENGKNRISTFLSKIKEQVNENSSEILSEFIYNQKIIKLNYLEDSCLYLVKGELIPISEELQDDDYD